MKVKIKGFVTYNNLFGGDEFNFTSFDPRKYDAGATVFVKEHAFEVEVPDNFDPRPAQVEALKKQRETVQAQFAKRVMEIDTQIQSLLALEAT